jgi:hypothetical protein
MQSPSEDPDLRRILDELGKDADALTAFRDDYAGTWDALDALIWRIEPAAPGATGATNPLQARRDLETATYSRPVGTDGQRDQADAATALHALNERAASEGRALDAAIARAAPTPEHDPLPVVEPAGAEPTAAAEPDAPGRWAAGVRWLALAGGVAIAGGLLFAATHTPTCPTVDSCALALAPTGSPTPSVSATPFPSLAEQESAERDSYWDLFLRDFPDAQRPGVTVVRVVGQAEIAQSLVDCMHAAGFPETQLTGDGGVVYGDVPPSREEDRGLAAYICHLQYPIDPLSVFNQPQSVQDTDEERRLSHQPIVPGSAHVLLVGDGYRIVGYRLADPGTPADEPLVCIELAVDKTGNSNGACTTVEDFRQNGLRQASGVIWGPTGGPLLTAQP